MSNPTIELGGGKWATKPASLLAYNNHPEWGYNAKEFTVDRNSTATCVGSDGLIKTVQANEARIDYSNDPNGALLVEPQRTNEIAHSSDLTHGSWYKAFGGTGSEPIITPNAGIAPDGTNTANRVQFDRGVNHSSVEDLSEVWSNASFLSNKTRSFYAKSYDGNTYELRIGGTDGIVTITPEWQRFEWNSVSGERFRFMLRGGAGYETTNDTADVLIWGCQLEDAATASSYIPTNGTTVTRLGDILNTDIDLTGDFTLYFDLNYIVNNTYIFDLKHTSYTNRYLILDSNIYIPTVDSYMIFGGIVSCDKIAVRVENDTLTIFQDGVIIRTENIASRIKEIFKLYLGSRHTNTEQLNNIIRSFKYYNQALTDQELIDLTTI
jgi:hypothetical protein